MNIKRTVNKSVIKAVVKAWEAGMTNGNISKLFSVETHDIVNIIYAYQMGKKKLEEPK